MTSSVQRLLELPRYASDGPHAIKPGFDRIESILEYMGRPDREMDIALVAGTNGKGSTASMMAACLTSAGYKTALQTSPHLLRINERMRVNGSDAPQDWLERAAGKHLTAFRDIGTSFYEATLALSLLWFAEIHATHAVVETGLGGRLDATNVLDASVSVITSVDLDHTELLGDTIAAIATEKAGIIKARKPVVLGNMYIEAAKVISDIALQREAPVWDFQPLAATYPSFQLALAGRHQADNASTALRALDAWGFVLDETALREGLEHTPRLSGLRARSEIARDKPLLMIDVAHNPAALKASIETFLEHCSDENVPRVIIGLLADKDIEAMAQIMSAFDLDIYTVDTDGARGLSAIELASKLRTFGLTASTAGYHLKHELLETRDCLITGSHTVAASAIEGLK